MKKKSRKKNRSLQHRSYFPLAFLILAVTFILFQLTPGLTGFAIYDPSLVSLSYVSPTPLHQNITSSTTAFINVTSSVNLTQAWLEWNLINETLQGQNQNWFLEKTGTGNFTYRVYGNISNGTYGTTEERTLTLGFVQSPPQNTTNVTLFLSTIVLPEDSNFTSIDLLNATTPTGSSPTYSLLFHNQTYLNCSINSNRYLNCTLVKNAYGTSSITISTNQNSTTFSINITPVNDPPTLTQKFNNLTLSSSKNTTLALSNFFTDAENDSINYTTTNPDSILFTFNQSNVQLTPKEETNAERNFTFIASDGKNSTHSNMIFVQLTALNITPAITQEAFTIPPQQWTKNTPRLLDLTRFTSVPSSSTITLTGLSKITSSINGTTITLTPPQDWNGTEQATITLTSQQKILTSNQVTFTVVSLPNNPPVLSTAFSPLSFEEGTTNLTLNLSQHFTDPDHDPLTYTFGETVAVTTALQGQDVAIFTLAEPSSEITNETVKISATDPTGAAITQDLTVTLAAVQQQSLSLGWLLYLFVAAFVVTGLVVAYKKRDALHFTMPGVSTDNWMARLYWKMLTPKKNPTYKQETYHLKELLGILEALMSGTEDNVAKKALSKEKPRLKDAYSALSSILEEDERRKEILTLREIKSSFMQIRELTNDQLIKEELEKADELLAKILKSFSK
ncbi:MAG: Ig-like domain-containing protein [Candidatus Nanoarchaeia archaeon]